MKIGFFVHGYLPWDIYGVPRYVETLGSHLASQGHKIFIFVVGRPNLKKIEIPQPNITIYRTKYFEIPFNRLKPYWSLGIYTLASLVEISRFIKKEKIQILHGHTLEWGGLQSLIAAKLTGKPCLITVHGSGFDKYHISKRPWFYKFLKLTNGVIVQKLSASKRLSNWGFPDEKKFLLKGFVDCEKFYPSENKDNNIHIVSFVGRLIEFKAPHLLMDAIPKVLSKYPNTIFQFVGEGNLKSFLVNKAKSMGISDHVKFLGIRNDVSDILRRSDISLSLSSHENVSDLVLLESMATGIPVIATDVGETKSVIKDGETGLLVKFDAKDVAEKIIKILENQLFASQLSSNARQYIMKEHSLDFFAKKHEKLYSKMINNG